MSTNQKSTVELGQLISKHSAAFSKKWGLLGLGVLLIGLGPVAYVGISNLLANSSAVAQEVLNSVPVLQYSPLIAGILFPLMGVFCLYVVWRNWPLVVRIYEQGMEYADRRGTRQILWQDMEKVHRYIVHHRYMMVIPLGTDYTTIVYLRGGEILSFDDRFGGAKKIGQVLQERFVATHLPRYMADIRAGKRVEFGNLRLDQEGIYKQNEMLKWSEVERVVLNDKALSIAKKGSRWGNWANVPVGEVPNAALFYAIAREFGAAR